MPNAASLQLRWIAALLVAGGCVTAQAAPLELAYDSLSESKTTFSPLNAANPVRLTGLLNNTSPGSIVDTYSFVAGSSSLALTAGWLFTLPANRTTGVNIDLFDATNTVIASDTLISNAGGLAQSRLTATGLVAGAMYHLEFTGTAFGAGRFQIDLVDGATAPPLPIVAPALPASTDHFLFDTHLGTKSATATLDAGDTIVIDGAIANDGAQSIENEFTFRLTGGTVSAGIEWVVGLVTDPLRTVGVNVDLSDSMGNVVLSDSFKGVFNGEAFSQFSASGLPDGDYTLAFTGFGANGGGRFRIDLATSATPPGFRPIVAVPPNAVPEPAPLSLLVAGLALLGLTRPRRSRGRVERATDCPA